MRNVVIFLLLFGVLLIAMPAHLIAETEQEIFESGVIELQNGNFQQAVDLFTEIIMDSPDNAKSYKNRGVALMRLSRFDLALKDFNRAVAIDPDLVGIYSNLGAAWHYKQEYEKAIENYNKEISIRPDEYITYFNRALSRIELKQYTEALEDLNRTLELKPDLPWAVSLKDELLKKNSASATLSDSEIGTTAAAVAKTESNESLKETDKASPETPPGGSGDGEVKKYPYAVQAGAFTDLESAERLKDRLTSSGYDTWILELPGAKGKTWYLVRTGKYLGFSKATLLCQELKEKFSINAVVRTIGKF